MSTDDIPLRPFGRHPERVSALALGGFHVGKVATEREAIRLVHAAIDAGVTFLDNAWEYHDGKSEVRMGQAIEERRDQVFLMTKVCTHGRDKKEAMQQLEQSLRRLQTDYLDLWKVHECVVLERSRERTSPRVASSRRWTSAKRQGKVRFVGFTGHKDPEIHLEMLSYEFPFDSCPVAAERVRRDIPQLRTARAAGTGSAAGSRPWG